MIKVWTNTKFSGHWPVGVAAVVIAVNEEEAAVILNSRLKEGGLKGDAEASDMRRLLMANGNCAILCDGNY